MKKYKVKIDKIVPIGICETYDLYADSNSHSYIANGFITHNSLHSGQAMVYTNRKLGKEEAIPMHPVLENITKDTQHTVLYQEQIMQIMHEVGNMSWATAEMARKVITKSKGADAFNKLRAEFVTNANSFHKIPIEEAEKLYDVVSTFGCLTGDTKIYRCSSNQYKKQDMTVKEAYDYQKNDNFKHRKLKILSMCTDGRIRYNTIKKIHKTGIQKSYWIKTDSNKTIKATGKHRFLINSEWEKVLQFKLGDYITVTDFMLPKKIYGNGTGKGYIESNKPRPKTGKGIANEKKEQIEKLRNKYNNSCQICGSKSFCEMHHIDKNHKNNSDKNTMLICRKCHRKYTGKYNYARFKEGYCTYQEKITEIREIGERDTYDIEMVSSPRNFVANGFISHNSYGFNKCIKWNTPIFAEVNNTIIKMTIQNAYEQKVDKVCSYSFKTDSVFIAPVKEIMKTGKKEIILIKCGTDEMLPKDYKTIETTPDHKFLTKGGWKKLSGLKLYDKVLLKFDNNPSSDFKFARIMDILPVGMEETYDIHVDHPEHNYIANGFVVHNCHAVEYSMISYHCAWLKLYYPEFFYKSILKFESEPAQIQNFIQEAELKGIAIEYPDINKSLISYEIVDKKIYAGLNSIIGLGDKAAEKIIKNRPYTSIEDFKKKTKVNENIFKGLVIADAFRSFNTNKKSILETKKVQVNLATDFTKPIVKPKIEDYTNNEYVQLLYQHTTLKPKINITESYDFGDYDFVNVVELNEEHGNKQCFMRGIITEVVNKDKITRDDLLNHIHKFERHTVYLNMNDGTGNLALVMAPQTYELYQKNLKDLVGCPLVALGTISQDFKKMFCDMIQVVDGDYKDDSIDRIFLNNNLKNGEAYITSASPAVSKKGKSYYRIKLYNNKLNKVGGLCFNLSTSKLLPGIKVRWSMRQEPFIDIFPVSQ